MSHKDFIIAIKSEKEPIQKSVQKLNKDSEFPDRVLEFVTLKKDFREMTLEEKQKIANELFADPKEQYGNLIGVLTGKGIKLGSKELKERQ